MAQSKKKSVTYFDQNNNEYKVYTGKNSKSLGKGSYGTVKLAWGVTANCWVAMKVVNVDSEKREKELNNEIALLKKLNRLHGIYIKKTNKYPKMHIFQDFFDGLELKQLNLLSSQLPQFTQELIKALEDFHQKKIIHSDIKPENFLYDTKLKQAALIDVGLSVLIDNPKINNVPGKGGSPFYYAPEKIHSRFRQFARKKTGLVNKKTDIYALGLTMLRAFGLEKPVLWDFIKQSRLAYNLHHPDFAQADDHKHMMTLLEKHRKYIHRDSLRFQLIKNNQLNKWYLYAININNEIIAGYVKDPKLKKMLAKRNLNPKQKKEATQLITKTLGFQSEQRLFTQEKNKLLETIKDPIIYKLTEIIIDTSLHPSPNKRNTLKTLSKRIDSIRRPKKHYR